MSLIQIIGGLYFAFIGAYLSIVMGRVLKQNGTVLHKIDESIGKIDKSISKMDEGFRKMDERAEQRHQDIVELLKKGFGELTQRRAT